MKSYKRIEWRELDNASKIFPSTANNKDTKVYRITCELYENVDHSILQEALDLTLEVFPLYKSILRRGAFWYYFEISNLSPTVNVENTPLCSPIYIKDKRTLLFRVSYYNKRINLETFHALSDGAGAVWFIETLIFHYLVLKHKDTFNGDIPEINYKASISQKMDDSFWKNYHRQNKTILKKRNRRTNAYRIKGTRLDENRMKLIEGSMSVNEVLKIAHEYNTTLTIFLTSLFFYSIYKDMPVDKQNYPIILSVPINLRQYYDSETARNFFSTMNVSYNFEKNSYKLEDIIKNVDNIFRRNLTKEEIDLKLMKYISLENNSFARMIPLPLKDIVLKIADKINDRKVTTSISNIGRIDAPQEIKRYIRSFSVSVSARSPKITLCSFEDNLVISFTSPFRETDIQRTFFQFLSNKGLEVEISSNE